MAPVTQELGASPLLIGGPPELRARYLPGIASGASRMSFALTGPRPGRNVAAMTTTASDRADHHAAAVIDGGEGNAALLGSMAKCFATDAAMKVATDALQLLGGAGYMADQPTERYFRQAKLLQIVEGTNQIQRVVVAGQLLEEEG